MAEWIAQQITVVFPWSEAPRYPTRDQDEIYGVAIAPVTNHGTARHTMRT
jgi:hypothetical protein